MAYVVSLFICLKLPCNNWWSHFASLYLWSWQLVFQGLNVLAFSVYGMLSYNVG